MKQFLTISEKKKLIMDAMTQIGLDAERPERKSEIMSCLQLILPTEENGALDLFKDRLAEWFINNFFDLKANPLLFLQYGNLKFLTKQSRDLLLKLYKVCQQKIGQHMDYSDIYNSMLMKNPYYGYQPMSYMQPPFMMPPSYPMDRQAYQEMEKYSPDRQYEMFMSKYYPMNQMYMPPMTMMGMPKYPPTSDLMMKSPYYPYPMMPQPQPLSYPQPSPPPKQKTQTPITPTKQKTSQPIPRQTRETALQKQAEENSSSLKKGKQKLGKETAKNIPFFIINPNMQKPTRQQIPERIYPSTGNQSTRNEKQTLAAHHQSSEIEIIEATVTEPVKNQAIPKLRKQVQHPPISQKIQEERPKKQPGEIIFTRPAIETGPSFKQEFKWCTCKGYGVKKQAYQCPECLTKFHYACTERKIPDSMNQQTDVCHFCYMRNLDPLNKVEVQIKVLYVTDIRKNKIQQRIDFEAYDSFISKTSPYQIEVRSMRLQDAANSVPEYTWPDECLVMLNEERTIEFQALQHNSSLKKRKDMSVFLTNYIYFYNKNSAQRKNLPIGLEAKQNTLLEACQKKIRNNYTFLFGVYLIKKKTPEELCEQILKDPNNKVNFVQKFFSQPMEQEEIEIEQIKVTLMDPFTWNLIDIPARGRKCIHGQCFDLKTFLSFMNVQKVRQWKCPVCNKECRNFHVDTQQAEVIREFKKRESEGGNQKLSKQIEFHRDGRTLFVIQNEEDEEDEKNGSSAGDANKTKLITKAQSRQEK